MTQDIAESFSPGGWKFTPEVTDVFDEHVAASVPYYPLIQAIVAETTDWLLPNGGVYVDVGASTGTTAALIARRHPDRHIRAYLYDEVPEMLDKATEKLAGFGNLKVERRHKNVLSGMDHIPSDLITALFTLQFIAPEQRGAVLVELRRRSKPTGALIVAEKIRPTNSLWAEIACDASHDFKAEHGLSDTAIRQKAKALRGVLRPSTEDQLIDSIECSGWVTPEILFRWHQWVVVGALAS
jgi:tRNA (cmo5U34)-methyltransferase